MRFVLLAALAAIVCCECSQPPSGPDAQLDAFDAAPLDVADVLDTRDVPLDVSYDAPFRYCQPDQVINLDAVGTVSGNTTEYVGSNATAERVPPFPGDARCEHSVGYEVVLHYTLRTTAHLRVSTANAGTSTGFDTVVWLLDQCAPLGVTSLGCNDNAIAGDVRSTFVTADALAAGTSVFVLVAGSMRDGAGLPTGTFDLTVSEVNEVAVGATCDATGLQNVCAPGSHCIADGGSGTCLADGSLGGQCNGAAPVCDPGLACAGVPGAYSSRCRTEVEVGQPCDSMGVANACAIGSHCMNMGAGFLCTADGTLNAHCTTIAPFCQSGLACNDDPFVDFSRCVPLLSVGDSCDIFAFMNVCPAGSSCMGTETAATCIAFGASGGLCRSAAPFCDPSLACSGDPLLSTSVCLPAVSAGQSCDPTVQTNACVAGTHCIAGSSGATCVTDGALTGVCRTTDPACDTGSGCSGMPGAAGAYCVAAIASGGACDPSGVANVCVNGAHCLASGSGSVCVLDGTQGGRCRTSGLACDDGLGCRADLVAGTTLCVPGVPIGGSCDIAGVTNLCVSSAHCLGTGTTGTCVADGSLNGRCRTTVPLCDPGLGCGADPFTGLSSCVPAIALGGNCDLAGSSNVCVSGASCIGSGVMGVCQSDGTLGGQCRADLPRCDTGLACGLDATTFAPRCVPAVNTGVACDPAMAANACVDGDHCVTSPSGSLCVQDGTAGGRCRTSGLACDATLGCSVDPISGASLCVPGLATGAQCDPTGVLNVCVSGDHCVLVAGTPNCVVDGSLGGACRGTAPACDMDLACNGDPYSLGTRCVPVVSAGRTCDPAGQTVICALPSHCIPSADGSTATCIDDGARNGLCRVLPPQCDTGLVCNGPAESPSSRCVSSP